MVNYDPSIVQKSADHLYQEALNIVWASVLRRTAIGVVLGIVGGFIFALIQNLDSMQRGFPSLAGSFSLANFLGPAVACAMIGGITGYYSGQNKALELRLKAQQALCQLQIEKNTRPVQDKTP